MSLQYNGPLSSPGQSRQTAVCGPPKIVSRGSSNRSTGKDDYFNTSKSQRSNGKDNGHGSINGNSMSKGSGEHVRRTDEHDGDPLLSPPDLVLNQHMHDAPEPSTPTGSASPTAAKVHEYFHGTGRFFTRTCEKPFSLDRATWLAAVEPHYTHSAGCILVPSWPMDHFPTAADWPLPVDLLQAALSNHGGYISIWQSRAGDAVYLSDPPRFYVQAPLGEDFASFAACTAVGDRFAGVLVTADEAAKSLCYALEIPVEWQRTALPLAVVPLKLLQQRWSKTSRLLWELMRVVECSEEDIQDPTVVRGDLAASVRRLHWCNSALLRLERRWHFETKLAAAIRKLVADHGRFLGWEDVNSGFAFQKLQTESVTLSQTIAALSSELAVLPRRIQNALTALYNLNAQQDTKATIELAEQSRQIAKQSHDIAAATLRDSSAMKTIAAMTLIFLPATFLCSFFSMSFFDWHAPRDDTVAVSLWVYFAVAVPLTAIVILGWLASNPLTRRRLMGWLWGKSPEVIEDVESKRE